ncbi:MAG: PD-(D/E)XK nuclease family protein [Luteolibacter sp.]
MSAMIPGMVERVFLGWHEPFLSLAVEWMAARGADWSDTLVVVPTAQSGRRLREMLAEACGGAVLSPRTTTPGMILRGDDAPGIAENWEEELAWIAELESIADWAPYQPIMPEPDRTDDAWATGLARELAALRRELQENGHHLASAAKRLSDTVESERWQALAALERAMLQRLQRWGLRDRSRPFAEILPPVDRAPRILLAGVPDLPPVVAAAIEQDARPIISLVAAPESEATDFSPCGTPLQAWAGHELPWPDGRVHVASDPRHQAAIAISEIAKSQAASDAVAIGCPDAEVGEELCRALTHHGWTAFHPAGPVPSEPLLTWWRTFANWLRNPEFSTLAELLAFPQSGKLVGGARFQKSATLQRMMDEAMVRDTSDLRHQLAENPDFATHPDAEKAQAAREQAAQLLESASAMENWRASYQRGDFLQTTRKLLDIIATPEDAATQAIHAWLDRAEGMIRRHDKPAGFWLDLMLASLPASSPTPPDERVIDIQGWLEVFHEPGNHLVLCGLNEGRVPAKPTGETWLGEPARARLGLITADDRAARDAWLFHAITRARMHENGSVTLICGKSSAGGDALLPSRLLLTGDGESLARRVRHLFQSIEPPDAGLRREADDWNWQPPVFTPSRLPSATGLRDYLACPFRFYLKHVLRMRKPEPERGEWNARDFGNIIHKALEIWGGNASAHSASVDEIAGHLIDEADRIITRGFHGRPPLAVLLQREAMHQRLRWTARVLAEIHADGWEILETEKPIRIPVSGGRHISGTIDRIDRHRESGEIRIIDYKTGNLDERKSGTVEAAHRTTATAGVLKNHRHLADDCPAWHATTDAKGKPRACLWQNLQLPLYVAAVAADFDSLPQPCYLAIGNTRNRVALHTWDRFSLDEMKSAMACTEWIIERIDQGIFMPPAEKVRYDEFEPLAARSSLADLVRMGPMSATP